MDNPIYDTISTTELNKLLVWFGIPSDLIADITLGYSDLNKRKQKLMELCMVEFTSKVYTADVPGSIEAQGNVYAVLCLLITRDLVKVQLKDLKGMEVKHFLSELVAETAKLTLPNYKTKEESNEI